jgi:hypothetical protein
LYLRVGTAVRDRRHRDRVVAVPGQSNVIVGDIPDSLLIHAFWVEQVQNKPEHICRSGLSILLNVPERCWRAVATAIGGHEAIGTHDTDAGPLEIGRASSTSCQRVGRDDSEEGEGNELRSEHIRTAECVMIFVVNPFCLFMRSGCVAITSESDGPVEYIGC